MCGWLAPLRETPPDPSKGAHPPHTFPGPLGPLGPLTRRHQLIALYAELLLEGVEIKLIRGEIFTRGELTPRASELLERHGKAFANVLKAIDAGRMTRQGLVRDLGVPFQWPGTLEHVPKWPGRFAFVLGAEIRHCRDCVRLVHGRCSHYIVRPKTADEEIDWHKRPDIGSPTAKLNPHGVRCLAFVPKDTSCSR
jgi:hypothetical protein